MIKKFKIFLQTGAIVMTFLYLIFMFFSCAKFNLNKHAEYRHHVKNMERIYQNHNQSVYPNENFIHLEKKIITGDNSVFPYASASGIAIEKIDNKVYVLTAAHWCKNEKLEIDYQYFLEQHGYKEYRYEIRVSFYGLTYVGEVINYNEEKDICMISFKSKYAKKIKKIKIAKSNPKIGAPISTISAPLSIHSQKTRLHFKGKFGGCDDEVPFCFYTIPGTFGSSGSGVLNEHGELIGILVISITDFNHVTGGVRLEDIKKFVKENLP